MGGGTVDASTQITGYKVGPKHVQHIDWALTALPPMASDGSITLNVPVVLKHRAGRSWFENAAAGAPRRRPDRTLIAGLRRAHAELAKAGIHPCNSAVSWRDAVGINDSYLRSLVPLAFLAPDIQAAIMEGRQPDQAACEPPV